MKNTTTFAVIMTISFLATALFVVPAASADSTTVCPLDTPPCASVTTGTTTGDGDCDASNGSGSYANQVDVWTGEYPAGNQSAEVQNSCGPYDWLAAYVTIYTPIDRYPTRFIGVYWLDAPSGCYAGVFTGGRQFRDLNLDVDLAPVICPLGPPPVIPALP